MSSTVSEEGKTAMSKLIKDMASVCSIYDADFSNLTEEHELGTGGDVKGREDLVLAHSLYNVRMDPNDDNAGYEVF